MFVIVVWPIIKRQKSDASSTPPHRNSSPMRWPRTPLAPPPGHITADLAYRIGGVALVGINMAGQEAFERHVPPKSLRM
jgi:hypothetical protein